MADKERSSKTGGANSQSQNTSTRTPASTTATAGNQNTPAAAAQAQGKGKGKNKKNKDGAGSTGISSSGAQIVNDPAQSSGQNQNQKSKKGGGGADMVMRRPAGQNNTMEYRFDYVVSALAWHSQLLLFPLHFFAAFNRPSTAISSSPRARIQSSLCKHPCQQFSNILFSSTIMSLTTSFLTFHSATS